jgi:hypothetical protein
MTPETCQAERHRPNLPEAQATCRAFRTQIDGAFAGRTR